MEKISIYQDHRREQNFFSDSTGSKVAKIASSNTSFKPFCNMKSKSDISHYSPQYVEADLNKKSCSGPKIITA